VTTARDNVAGVPSREDLPAPVVALVVLASIGLIGLAWYLWAAHSRPVWAALALALALPMLALAALNSARGVLRQLADIERFGADLWPAEPEYHDLADLAHDYIFVIGADMRVRYVNRYAAGNFGGEPRSLIGRRIDHIFPPPMATRMMSNLRKVIEATREVTIEDAIAFPHRSLYLNTRLIPCRDRRGRITGVMGVSRDITERRHMEDALRESEGRFRSVFGQAPIALHVRDLSPVLAGIEALRLTGVEDVRAHLKTHPEAVTALLDRARVIESNQAALDLFEAESLEELAANLPRIRTPQYMNTVLQTFLDIAEGRNHFEGETLIRTLKGRERTAYLRATVMAGHERTLDRVLVSLTDLTDTRRAQQEVALSRIEALSATGRLAAGVAHEINNPLQGMKAQVRLLRDEPPGSPAATRRLDSLNGEIDKIARIVRGLLDLHRHGAQKDGICDAKAVIAGLTELVASEMAKSGVRVETALPEGPLWVRMEANGLTQTLLNLILNAQDAMPKGGAVRIDAVRSDGAARIAVTDQGVGITPEDGARIFTPFFTTKGPRGTGLGLSVSESIVRAAGGRITFTSDIGRGATFEIILPAAEKAGDVPEGPAVRAGVRDT
jgi:PAS domain S-box-containing protein